MNSLRDRPFRVIRPSSPVDPLAVVAITLFFAAIIVVIVSILFAAGAVTAWVRENSLPRLAPHVSAPPYELSFAGRRP